MKNVGRRMVARDTGLVDACFDRFLGRVVVDARVLPCAAQRAVDEVRHAQLRGEVNDGRAPADLRRNALGGDVHARHRRQHHEDAVGACRRCPDRSRLVEITLDEVRARVAQLRRGR